MATSPGEPENIGYVTFHFDTAVMAHVHFNWLARSRCGARYRRQPQD